VARGALRTYLGASASVVASSTTGAAATASDAGGGGGGDALSVVIDRPWHALRVGGQATLRTAHERSHSRHHFSRAEWLANIVICSAIQTQQTINFIDARRQHQNWYIAEFPDGAAKRQAIHAGQHQIEHQHGWHLLLNPMQSSQSVVHTAWQKSVVLKVICKNLSDLDVVFND
jgi:hypothetical protein